MNPSLLYTQGSGPYLVLAHDFFAHISCIIVIYSQTAVKDFFQPFADYQQGHLDIYYYLETRSSGMFGPWATSFLVLGCRSAGKLISWPPLTTPMAPSRRPQDCGTTTTRIVVVVPQSWGRRGGAIGVVNGGQEINFPALRQPSTRKVGARGPNIPQLRVST